MSKHWNGVVADIKLVKNIIRVWGWGEKISFKTSNF